MKRSEKGSQQDHTGIYVTKQLPLSESLKALFADEGRRLLAVTRSVILTEMKQSDDFADLVGVKPSQMSSALNGNGYHFALTWLPAALHIDRRRRIIEHEAKLIDCCIIEAELTDAAYRQKMEAALRRAGAAGEAIRRDALEAE